MKTRFIHVLILVLFLFQNTWAMEQTFLVFCDQQETSQELEQHNHDENNATTHDHSICNDCCHITSPLVGITQSSNSNNFYSEQHYNKIVKNNFQSINKEPSTPPPIV